MPSEPNHGSFANPPWDEMSPAHEAFRQMFASLTELVERRERACREQGGPVDGSDGRYARARAALALARGEKEPDHA